MEADVKKLLLAVGIASLLSGCAVVPNEEAIGPYPEDYKTLIQHHIRETYFDPYSIRSAEISMPERGHLFGSQGWYVCVKANAKNRLGAYVGTRKTAYFINRGRILHANEMPNVCDDPRAIYERWKELENME